MPEILEAPKFELQFIKPYSTFEDGEPKPIPYVIDGLLPQGGFSLLIAKPKLGNSSFAHIEAACVSSGNSFLDREVQRGEVIMVCLEEPRNHLDNCLKVLGYDPTVHAEIRILEKLPPKVDKTIDLLGEELTRKPDVKLITIDTLPKFLHIKDINEYMDVMGEVEQLHNLARKFPQLHVQALVHSKKVQQDDVFDSILGSTALRGEADTNLVIYQHGGNRIIATETRIGRNIPPTILKATMVESAGANVVKGLSLGDKLTEMQEKNSATKERKQKYSHHDRIITYLQGCEDGAALQESTLMNIEGKRQSLLEAVNELVAERVITRTGKPHSPTNPLMLKLDRSGLDIYRLSRLDVPLRLEERNGAVQ